MAEEVNGVRLTPTQQKIIDMLRDGQPHNIHEIHECLPDQLGPVSNVYSHIYQLKVRLRPYRRDIVGEVIGQVIYYRLVNHVLNA